MPKKSPTSFAKTFAELEGIVEQFEKNNLDLDDGLAAFERGLQLAAELKKTLDGVEQKIVHLKKKYQLDE